MDDVGDILKGDANVASLGDGMWMGVLWLQCTLGDRA